MAAHRRNASRDVVALLALVPAALAGTPAALRDASPATAPWWPPTLADSVAAAPSSGWAMSELGPMFMPTAVNHLVYGPPGAMTPGPKLQKILAKVWEHLASRVEDLESMERRAGLMEEEVAQLERRPLASEAVLTRIESHLGTLRSHAEARAEELAQKFRQVLGFRPTLRQRFPASRVPLHEFFRALEKASEKVDDRYREVGRTLTRIRERLVSMREPADPDNPRWRPDAAPDIPRAAARQPTAQEIREKMAALRAESEAQRAAESMAVMPGPGPGALPAPPPASGSDWDPSWEDDVRSAVREPVPVARGSGDPIEAWESSLAAPGADSMYAGTAARHGEDRTGAYPSARELIRDRYQRLQEKAAGGASTEDLEREIRSRRPGDSLPGQVAPRPAGPLQPADGQELLEDFLERDTVMDPYLSKAVGTLRAPDQAGGDERLAEGMRQLLAGGAGPGGAAVRAAPQVERLGNFATRLEHELELAARTEGLDESASFRRPRRAKVPLPQGTRSVASIMEELEALDAE